MRKRADDHLIGNAVGQTHIARAGKRTSRNQQKILFLGLLTKFFLILHRRFHEEIESSLRFDAGKAGFLKPLIKCFPVSVIVSDIGFLFQAPGHDSLEE